MIIWTDILIMSILHPESTGDGPKLLKAQTFIKVSCMDIVFNYSIELKNTKSKFFSFTQAVKNQLFSDMLATGI